ncbi:bacterioferritin-associated ferredoxin [Acuticoccus sp. I52.16.1]|uniref:(2Fe-2S)-binding protein n=1 Tax=Acuticoccus sp. I52.16.1 TaxID=2928472 RepID=UPI001FD5A6D3|nr:(2Fe-2S)-binding protein [Acuticoccus sp. I52.16.1]UOM37204.1 (2Fe-2S)-binding protein [Acuticoccus sp. I52.16.1]
MIVCHCNIIKRTEIREAVRSILAADPSGRLEPQYVYRELQKRGRCCSCFPLVSSIVEEMLQEAMHEIENPVFGARAPSAAVRGA